MIVYEYVRWKNFLSTGNQWTEVRLDKDPTTLIIGANGHGKSTLLDALTFCSFGKPFRDINLPNLVNSINGKDCVVEEGFRSGNTQYKVVRGIAPKIFEIYENGVLVSQDAAGGDYQKWLEESVFKYNHKAFTQIVILGSKSFVPFMRLKPADRRNIIENLLDIEIFSAMNKVAGEQAKKYKEEVAANKIKIDGLVAQIELQKKHKEDSEKNAAEQVEKITAEIGDYRKEIQTLEMKVLNEMTSIEAAQKAITTITGGSLPADMVRLAIKIDAKIEEKKRLVTFYETNDNCPTCKQVLELAFKENTVEDTKKDIVRRQLGLDELKKKIHGVEIQQDIISKSSRAQNSYQHEISMRELQITEARVKRDAASSKKALSDEMIEISRKMVEDLTAATDERRKLIENKAYYDAAVSLLKDGGIKAQIVKQYLPVINQLVNKYLAAMDFFVNFELDEEFNETIKSRHRDTFKYDSFSEGEKQRIDLALLFAWRAVAKLKNSVNTNLLILDEIFDSSLDGIGADLVLSILSTMSEGFNIFIISHRELLQDRFSSIIKFEKRNNFSTVTQEY
jgi:DNA repair exonuclease SbcCD ATPase subunit